MVTGESIELLCNTSLSSDVMWTYDAGGVPYVHYVYWNGHIDTGGDRRQLSVKVTRGDVHTLLLSEVRLNDSGLYSCYDENGLRKVGYQLIVNGLCFFVSN